MRCEDIYYNSNNCNHNKYDMDMVLITIKQSTRRKT